MNRNPKRSGPTRRDAEFHRDNPALAENSIAKGLKSGNLTEDNAMIIRQFVAEQKGIRGICVNRVCCDIRAGGVPKRRKKK